MSMPPAKRATKAETAWMAAAACRDLPPGLFFPERGVGIVDVTPAAKQTCRGCPVRWRCHRHAVVFNEQGVWGASTDDERKTTRKRLKVLQAGLKRQALAQLAAGA